MQVSIRPLTLEHPVTRKALQFVLANLLHFILSFNGETFSKYLNTLKLAFGAMWFNDDGIDEDQHDEGSDSITLISSVTSKSILEEEIYLKNHVARIRFLNKFEQVLQCVA